MKYTKDDVLLYNTKDDTYTQRHFKIALVVSHMPFSKGSSNKKLNLNEWDFNNTIAHLLSVALKRNLNVDVKVINGLSKDFDNLNYSETLYKKVELVNNYQPDLAIELHLNSSVNSSINGTETLYWVTSETGKEYANIIQNNLVRGLLLNDRKIKPIAKTKGTLYKFLNWATPENFVYEIKMRGWIFLGLTCCPAIITEPFFLSNTDYSVCSKYLLFKEHYVNLLYNSIKQIIRK